MKLSRWVVPAGLFIIAGLGAAGCSAESYRRSADRQVQEIVVAKRKEVTGREEPFSFARKTIPLSEVGRAGETEDLKQTAPPKPIIQPLEIEEPEEDTSDAPVEAGERPQVPSTAPPPGTGEAPEAPSPPLAPQVPEKEPGAQGGTPPSDEAPGSPAPAAESAAASPDASPASPKIPARILDLTDALRIAFANNRNYQTQKESVYRNALALTLARWQFAPRFFGLITGNYDRDSSGQESGGVSSDFGWNQLFASGAQLSLSVANNFLKFFTGDRQSVANTIISGTLTQPLLRGFGKDIVLEPLIQAERNVIYEIRSFERFRQTFLVQVATEFYRVLQARNLVSNEYLNWQGLVNNLDRARALAEGERLPKFEVDQVLQQELQAQNRYVVAVETYQSVLDRFKITLDVPIDASIALDEGELEKLESIARTSLDVDVDEAIAAALRLRLDLQTARDQAEDAKRKVMVAANGLQAQLDLSVSASLASGKDGAQQPTNFDVRNGTYGAGFDLNLPFDRRAERNIYAAALIDVDAEARAASLFEDNVRTNVRDSFRQLFRQKETYKIQEASVKLAVARVESTNTLRDAGRADTRDVLESQSALIEAKNALTSALINLAIAKLEFASDTGTLRAWEDGRFEEAPIPRAEPISQNDETNPEEAKNG